MPLRIVRIDSKHAGEAVALRWSSIFSGAFLMLGMGIAFLVLGDAVGLSAHNAVNPGVHGALKFWSWLYTAGTLVFSYFFGSALATRSSEIEGLAAGGLHGLVSWGFATSVATFIAVYVSPAARLLLTGTGTDVSNWLAICIIGVGFFAAAFGGMSGKKAIEYRRMELEEGTAQTGSKVETVNKSEAA